MPVAALPTFRPLSLFPFSVPNPTIVSPLHRPPLLLSFPTKSSASLLPPRAKDLDSGHWADESRQLLRTALDSAADVCEGLPRPIRSFPWSVAAARFVGTLSDLVLAVVRYLCVPVLAVSCLGEMSFCAHERKMKYIPLPFLLGVAVAVVCKQTAVDLAPDIQEGIPWHLVAMGVFFLLLKLPGPYYPYLGRLVIPHFANGGLWSTVWFAFQWLRMGNRNVERRES